MQEPENFMGSVSEISNQPEKVYQGFPQELPSKGMWPIS